jgi:hypothetical protein
MSRDGLSRRNTVCSGNMRQPRLRCVRIIIQVVVNGLSKFACIFPLEQAHSGAVSSTSSTALDLESIDGV